MENENIIALIVTALLADDAFIGSLTASVMGAVDARMTAAGLALSGQEAEKVARAVITCSLCGQAGHNARTCAARARDIVAALDAAEEPVDTIVD